MSDYKNLPIRFKIDDYRDIESVAASEKLKVSTWIRQLVLQEVESRKNDDKTEGNAPLSQ